MKKSTKLLSIFLAVIMILSTLTVGAFAAKTSYQTVGNLESLQAYSPYGTVTRLSTEERMSILMDWLDRFLATKQDLNMGEVFNKAGISIYINLTSVDEICKTLDSFRAALTSGTWSFAATFVNLGVLEDLEFSSWQSGMSRSGTAQLTIIYELLELLSKNTTAVNTILTSGIDLGLANSALSGVDMGKINGIVTDLPSFAKSMIMQKLFNRPDDTAALRTKYAGNPSNANLVTYLDDFVKGIFTKPMNWTSYREDAAGNDLHYTLALPTTNASSRYFTRSGNTITQYDYDYEKATHVKTVEYVKSEEFPGSDTYLFRAPEGYEGDATLKWYKDGDEGYFLPSVRDAINNGALTFTANGSDNVLGLVYKFAPYLFREMAVVVLNGSVKKLVAELFGVEFTKIGDRNPDDGKIYDGDGNVVTGLPNDTFFTKDQDFYLWEYTDYIVIDDVPYYRYQEEYFKGNLPLHLSSYYTMFNWNFKITGDWADEFIPGAGSSRTRILPALNDFIGKAIKLVILPEWESKGATYTRDDIFAWEAGDLDKLASNILHVARKVFPIAPEEIIDDYYYEAQFYDVMMNNNGINGADFSNADIMRSVKALICECVKLLMPQIVWPDNVVDQDMLAIAAIVVRELLTDLMPSYDFDALIYSSYTNRALIEGKDKTYWTNVVLTMGMDIGMYYLRNLADLGEDTANSYFKVMANQGALPTNDAETQTYPADYDVSQWLKKVDWVIDWALSTTEWGWRMSKLVNVSFNITTAEDPWAKLNTILLKILPLNQLLNANGGGYDTFLQNILQGKLVNAISDLDFAKFVSIFDVPSGYFTNTKILDQAVKLVVYILNGVTNTVLSGNDIFRSGTYTSLDALLKQDNLKTDVKNLVGKLTTLYNNGLLDVAMPFVTMFLGWKSDPQVYADPQLIFENSAGYNYFYTSGTETLKVSNGSCGMLLKHRNSTITDSPYNIKITAVSSNDGTIGTSTSLPKTIAPWGETTLTLTNSSTTARTVQVTIAYEFTGKDGAPIGGTQYATNTTYVTSQKTSSSWVNQSQNYKTKGGFLNTSTYTNWYRDGYESIVFTNYKGGIESTGIQFTNEGDYTSWVIAASQKSGSSYAPTSPLQMFTANVTAGGYVHGANDNASYKDADHGWMSNKDDGANVMIVYPTRVNGDLVSGTAYKGGTLNITIGNAKNGTSSRTAIDVTLPTFYYYNTSVLNDVWAKAQKVSKEKLSGDYTATYNAFLTKLDAAAQAMVAPKLTSNFSTIFAAATLDRLAEELDAAYQALIDGGYYAVTDYTTNRAALQGTLDTCEDRANGEDYDFADHALFEYFQYEKQRTSTREKIKSLTEPEAPQKYIDGEALSQAQIEAIIAAQTNTNIVTGINNTFWNPSQEALDGYAAAMAAWKPADISDLEVQNQQALLVYYKQFMDANTRDLTAAYQKQFLNREIAYAQAQNYDQSIYTPATWAVYADALADAQAVAADSSKLPSEIFDAKYALMIAQHDLLKIERSMKEDGQNYLDGELTGLIANAEVILNNINYYDVVDGMTQAEALGTLVRALGVRYTNENGDAAILYDHSAYTFVDWDRVDSTKNRIRVDEAADKLQAAIDNFVCNVVLESTDATVISDIETDVKLIKGVKPGAIRTVNDLLNYVQASNNAAILRPYESAAGFFGTGAGCELSINNIGIVAIYKVLIFGDVNGDGAIDAFDIFTVDKASGATPIIVLEDVYRDAADISADGEIGLADYNAVRDDVAGTAAIDQAA